MYQKQPPAKLEAFGSVSRAIRRMIQGCWEYEPESRPTMARCLEILQAELDLPVAPPQANPPSHLVFLADAAVQMARRLYGLLPAPTTIVVGLVELPAMHLPRELAAKILPAGTLFGPSLKRQFLEGRRQRRALLVSPKSVLLARYPKELHQIGISYPKWHPLSLRHSTHTDVRNMMTLLVGK